MSSQGFPDNQHNQTLNLASSSEDANLSVLLIASLVSLGVCFLILGAFIYYRSSGRSSEKVRDANSQVQIARRTETPPKRDSEEENDVAQVLAEPVFHDDPPSVNQMNWLLECFECTKMFEFLDAKQKREIVYSMRRITLPKGYVCIEQGSENVDQCYICEVGSLEVRVFDKVMVIIEPGWCFGELGFIFGCPRSATCIALEPTSIWVLERAKFDETISQIDNLFQVIRSKNDISLEAHKRKSKRKQSENSEEDDSHDTSDALTIRALKHIGYKEEWFAEFPKKKPALKRFLSETFMTEIMELEYVGVDPVVAKVMDTFAKSPNNLIFNTADQTVGEFTTFE